MHAYIHAYIHTYIHIYIYTRTDTELNMHIYIYKDHVKYMIRKTVGNKTQCFCLQRVVSTGSPMKPYLCLNIISA